MLTAETAVLVNTDVNQTVSKDVNEPPYTSSVEESVFKGYLERAVREWVLAGKPYKR